MMFPAAIAIGWVAAAIDVRSRRIPNWLTYSAMLLGIGYHTITDGATGFLFGAAGLLLGLALLVVFYLRGGMGAGDVKLMGAVGALLGPKGVFISFVFTALAGGMYAIILLLLRLRVKGAVVWLSTMLNSVEHGTGSAALAAHSDEKITVLNYGLAIAIGVSLSVVWNVYVR